VLLAFDTATPAVTVALHDGERVLASSTTVDARRHGELLAPGILLVLDEAWVAREDVTAVAVGVGPGPFTGLRVGLATARTLGAVLEIPVYGVCTLDVLAAEAVDAGAVDGPFLVATDARRKEVYWAAYDAAGVRIAGPSVDKPGQLPKLPVESVAGNGATLYDLGLPHTGREFPTPLGLARVARSDVLDRATPGPFTPLYLRRPDAEVPGARKRVTTR